MSSNIFEPLPNYPDEAYPKVTVVIPTFNSSLLLPRTLDSIFLQEYPDLEIIVVDASSTDRTIEIVKNYEHVRLYSVSNDHFFEMLNKGISLATGEYINFLRPGDTYLSKWVLKQMMSLALDQKEPDLVFAASLIRIRWEDVSLKYFPLALETLYRGMKPTFLEACFFNKKIFQSTGKFDINYSLRSDFDFFCRYVQAGDLKSASTLRVINDSEEREARKWEIWQEFVETWKIIYRHFGYKRTFKWLLHQEDFEHFLHLMLNDIKKALGAN